MPHRVAFPNETVNDLFQQYTLNGTSTSTAVGVVVSSLPTAPTLSVPYFKDSDENGVVDACAVIPSGNTATGYFQRPDLSTYTVQSMNFTDTGTHPPQPPTRPS